MGNFVITSGSNDVGLFGLLGMNGRLSNVGVVSFDINTTGDNVGGLAGRFYHSSINNQGTVVISNSYAIGRVRGRGNVGGLIGIGQNGVISSSYAMCRVQGNSNVNGIGWPYIQTSSSANCVYDWQGTARKGGTGTARSSLEMTAGGAVTGLGGTWTFNPDYYPQLPVMAENSGPNSLNVRLNSAFSVVPVLFTNTTDTSANVAAPIAALTKSAPVLGGAPLNLDWSWEPQDALAQFSPGDGILLLIPNRAGDVTLTARAAAGLEKEFFLTLPGQYNFTSESHDFGTKTEGYAVPEPFEKTADGVVAANARLWGPNEDAFSFDWQKGSDTFRASWLTSARVSRRTRSIGSMSSWRTRRATGRCPGC